MKRTAGIKKMTAILLAVIMCASMGCVGGLSEDTHPVSPVQAGAGRLVISEEGTYTLTGNMRGTVWIDPGAGSVRLILDNVTIDGVNAPAIVALSGDDITIEAAEQSVNEIRDGGQDTGYHASIYSRIDTKLTGNGSVTVEGRDRNGIEMAGGRLTVENGNWFVRASEKAVSADMTHSGGVLKAEDHVSFPDTMKADEETEDNQPKDETASAQNDGAQKLPVIRTLEDNAQKKAVVRLIDENDQEQAVDQTTDGNTQDRAVARITDNRPSMPAENENTSEQQNGEIRLSGGNNGNQGQMNQGNPGQFSNGMVPGNQVSGSQYESADEAGEIVTGVTTNSAALLTADMDNATTIVVTDESSQVKITNSGTYIVTGSSDDGNITVKKGTTGVVLILDDLDLTSTTGATLSVNKQAEVKIIVSGNVTLTDNENPEDEESEDEAVADAYDGAAIKVKAESQVYITGDGVLTINGNAKNGIKGGDDASIVIDGNVDINISAANDGINVNYDLAILDGKLTINAEDDAIHADHILTVGQSDGTGPEIDVESSTEGLEATVINIYGGVVRINSSDDAVNAANKDGVYEGVLTYSVNMMGGQVNIRSKGDGVDSNGNINLIGGNLSISSATMGGEAGIDYDGQLYISDNFKLENQSGVAGPDGMPGSMNGQMPGSMNGQNSGMPGMNNQNGSNSIAQADQQQTSGQNNAAPSDRMQVSIQTNPAPSEQAQVSVQTNPGQTDRMQVSIQTNPAPSEQMQVSIQTNPGQTDRMQVSVQTNPAPSEQIQVSNQSSSAQPDRMQVSIQTNPAPSEQIQVSVQTNPAQSERVQVSIQSNPAQSEQRQAPSQNNQGPADPQQAPSQNNQGPAELQQGPSQNNHGQAEPQQAPSQNNQGPAEPQQGPSQNNQGPTEPQQAPVEQHQEPSYDNPAPAEQHQEPSHDNPAPAEQHQEPSHDNPAPAEQHQEPSHDNPPPENGPQPMGPNGK